MEFREIPPNSIFKEFALENLSLTSVKSEHYNKSMACSKQNDSFQEAHKRAVLALLASEFTEDSKLCIEMIFSAIFCRSYVVYLCNYCIDCGPA